MDQSEKKKRNNCLNGIKLTADATKNACDKLATVNGRPLTLMNDHGFRDLIDTLIAVLPKEMILPSDFRFNPSIIYHSHPCIYER